MSKADEEHISDHSAMAVVNGRNDCIIYRISYDLAVSYFVAYSPAAL